MAMSIDQGNDSDSPGSDPVLTGVFEPTPAPGGAPQWAMDPNDPSTFPPGEQRQAARQALKAKELEAANQPPGTKAPEPVKQQGTQTTTSSQTSPAAKAAQQTGQPQAEAGREDLGGSENVQTAQSFAQVGGKEASKRGLSNAIFSQKSIFSNPGQGQFQSSGGAVSAPQIARARRGATIGGSPGAPSGALATPAAGILDQGPSSAFDESPDPAMLMKLLQNQFGGG
jgi:hypothetical protein